MVALMVKFVPANKTCLVGVLEEMMGFCVDYFAPYSIHRLR